ncbi:MAG: thiopurine S-methyltransferase [Nitrosomonadaceae bacterium]|nr:thiopurine S-methyltransferase [Nitrosomonadaceae bacterium]|tara:strand:- start:3362 stop:4033 length:672 start_codon:yes stop_codon:yes gene_type:complete
MEKDYWLRRWKQQEIGFHQSKANSYLCEHWEKLYLDQDDTVFVPLCGKSLDISWLCSQNYKVLGVEVSTIAVESFFKENKLIPNINCCERFDRYETDRISIFRGDFFNLNKQDLVKVRAVYDRASLVALPQKMRYMYVRHLLEILPLNIQILLITCEYSQLEMQGPPFSVSVNEVEDLFSRHSNICLLERLDVLNQYPKFYKRGLSKLHANIFLLTLKNNQYE